MNPIDCIKAVSHRNDIVSLEDLADIHARGDVALRKVLVAFGADILQQTAWAYQKATASAVAQCAALIRDPQYYETKKQRATNARKRTVERQREEEEQRRREESDPELMVQRAEMQLHATRMSAAYHEGELAQLRRKEAAMLGMTEEDEP